MTTLSYTEELVVETCISCGCSFAWPASLRQYRLDNRHDRSNRDFYCPSGHVQYFVGKTDAQKLREQLDREEARRRAAEDQARAAENARRAQKAANTRLRNRVANGVCPFCKRTFANVAAHMETKHHEEKVSA